jgi:hypothetical protein
MPGIITASKTDHQPDFLRQHVNHLALAFIPPLSSNNSNNHHYTPLQTRLYLQYKQFNE